jgi:hypothetical protein
MKKLRDFLPEDDKKRKRNSIAITTFISAILTIVGIYGIGQYGIALFILTPIFIGLSPVILYGYEKPITLKQSFLISFQSLLTFTLLLLVFAIEGLICVIMAAPFGIVLSLIGSFIGFSIIKKNPKNSMMAMFILIFSIPTMGFVEKDFEPNLQEVVTSIEINTKPKKVWENVIEFPQLDEPTEFIFKTGIAYPISAKIKGRGVGAVRDCNFTTGSFVEPITVWDEPNLLKFDVLEQPTPMKELNFWDIDAPHLHDYFVSKKGQFKLTELPNGKTLLEGTTWYYHNIRPELYWKIWSNLIIHKIHERVLTNIKRKSEEKV